MGPITVASDIDLQKSSSQEALKQTHTVSSFRQKIRIQLASQGTYPKDDVTGHQTCWDETCLMWSAPAQQLIYLGRVDSNSQITWGLFPHTNGPVAFKTQLQQKVSHNILKEHFWTSDSGNQKQTNKQKHSAIGSYRTATIVDDPTKTWKYSIST